MTPKCIVKRKQKKLYNINEFLLYNKDLYVVCYIYYFISIEKGVELAIQVISGGKDGIGKWKQIPELFWG